MFCPGPYPITVHHHRTGSASPIHRCRPDTHRLMGAV